MKKNTLVLAAVALAFAAGVGVAQVAGPPSAVQLVELPLKLPAVGNLDAVRQWRFGRIESVEIRGASEDFVLTIRMGGGATVRVLGPGPQLNELAARSEWIRYGTTASRSEYTERMVAFDVDDQHRLIALISLEPLFRDPNRLRRALGP